jgi:hypothetical protein
MMGESRIISAGLVAALMTLLSLLIGISGWVLTINPMR